MKKPANYWKKFSNLRKELEPLIKRYKRLPSARELKKIGLQSLYRNGINFHGGSNVVAKKLNTKTYDQAIERVSKNHWTFKNAVKALNEFILEKNLKLFPTNNQLRENKRYDLLGVIYKFKRSKFFKAKELKVERVRKGNNIVFRTITKKSKWTFDLTMNELKKIVDEVGHFPSPELLDNIGKSDLRGAIQKFGGSLNLWEKLGKPNRKNTKYQYRRKKRTKKEVVDEFRKLAKKLNHPPSEKELFSLDKFDLLFDIRLHFNSVYKLSDFIGYDPNIFGMYKTRSGNFVRSLSEAIFCNILTYLKIPHQYEGIIDPNHKRKYKFDFKAKDLSGKDIFVEIWGYEDIKRSDSGIFRKVIKNYQIKKQAKIKVYKNKRLKLIQIKGQDINGSSILQAYEIICKLLLKYNLIKKIPKVDPFTSVKFLVFRLYDLNVFKEELKKAEKKIGFIPSYAKLIDCGYSSLANQMMKLGGFPLIRKQYNLKSS